MAKKTRRSTRLNANNNANDEQEQQGSSTSGWVPFQTHVPPAPFPSLDPTQIGQQTSQEQQNKGKEKSDESGLPIDPDDGEHHEDSNSVTIC